MKCLIRLKNFALPISNIVTVMKIQLKIKLITEISDVLIIVVDVVGGYSEA